MNKNADMLGNHNVKGLLIKLSLPAIAGMAMNALYNFVDTLFVGRGAGEIAIGGLALAFPVQMIVMAVGLMVGMGSASIFSRAFGEKDTLRMHAAVNTALVLDVFLAILFTVLGFLFIDKLLVFFGATSSNIIFAKDYLSIILIGLVPLSLSMVLNNLTRAEGRAKVAMISMLIGTGLNVILDPIFIFDFGFGLGVQGAAIATVISQIIAFIYIFIQANGKHSSLNITLKDGILLDFKMMKEIILIGAPTFLRNATGAFLSIIIYRLINYYSTGDPAIYISIYGVINRVLTFVFMPAFGIVQGLAPIVGFNYGAKKEQRLLDVIVYAMKIIIIYFFFGFLFIQLLATSIFTMFSPNSNLEFITIGSQAFRILSIGFLLVGFQVIVSSIYQSEGFPLRATMIALSRQVFFFIPLVYLFTYLLGIEGIWISFAASDILAGLLSMILFFLEMKKIRNNLALEPARI
ncbi:MAG: MATE family efflux transporter [Firmicutes bacterium]|nr:MATE family efflux transporter [Bacillota bacterium]